MFSNFGFAINGLISLLISCFILPLSNLYKLLFPFKLDKINLRGYIGIITGGNTGIGKYTAINLVRRGCHIIIACRDKQRAIEAIIDIERIVKNSSIKDYPFLNDGKIEFMLLDLSSLTSIDNFSYEFHQKFKYLDFLINNGGINTRGVVDFGNEKIQQLFSVNYLGHYYLFRRLQDLLQTPNSSLSSHNNNNNKLIPSRVINLSSVTHHQGYNNYMSSCYYGCLSKNKYLGCSPYADSKLYLNYLTMEINKRFSNIDYFPSLSSTSSSSSKSPKSNLNNNNNNNNNDNNDNNNIRPIISLSVNPGAVKSDIWRSVPSILQFPYNIFMSLFYLTVEQGSSTSYTACILPLSTLIEYNKDINFETKQLYGTKSISGHLINHPLIPYLIPYHIYFKLLAFEMINSYAGSQWGYISLPPNSETISLNLWNFSCDVINKALEVYYPTQEQYEEKKLKD